MMKRALFLSLFLLLPLHAFAAQSIIGLSQTSMAPAAARYYTIQGVTVGQTGNGNAFVGGSAPISGVLGNLIFTANVAPGSGESFLYTVMKNGASTTITCTIPDLATRCEDNNTQHFISFVPGDRLQVQIIGSAAASAVSTGSWGMKMYPLTLGEQMFLVNEPSTITASGGTAFNSLTNARALLWLTTETQFAIWPDAGTFDKLTVFTSAATGAAPKAYDWILRKNFADTALDANQSSATSLTATDTANSATVTVGDLIDYKYASTSNPALAIQGFGLRYKSTGNTTSVFLSTTWGTLDTTATRFMVLNGERGTTGVENLYQAPLPEDLLFTTIVASTTDPTPGSRLFALRVNSVTTSLSCSIPSGSTHCTGSGNVIARRGDLVNITNVASASPATGNPIVSVAAQEMHGMLSVRGKLSLGSQNGTNLTNGLLHYWKLDESSGTAADSVGSLTMTNNNTLAFAAAKINNGAVVTPTQWLSNASNVFTTVPTGYTFNFWAKINTAPSGTTMPFVYANNDDQTTINYQDTAGVKSIQLRHWTSGGVSASDLQTQTLTVGTFYMITGVWTGSKIQLYLNGATLGGTVSASGFGGSGNSNGFGIGDDPLHDFAISDLTIDELGVWSRALTQNEITALYNATVGCQYGFGVCSAVEGTLNVL